MSVGSKLKYVIDETGRNAFEVGRAAGVSDSTIYGLIKRDSDKVTLNILYRLARELEVDLEFFVDDDIKEEINKKRGTYRE